VLVRAPFRFDGRSRRSGGKVGLHYSGRNEEEAPWVPNRRRKRGVSLWPPYGAGYSSSSSSRSMRRMRRHRSRDSRRDSRRSSSSSLHNVEDIKDATKGSRAPRPG
jgi:hypothetical protein